MATFGSLSLLIALALAAYNLFAGVVALRLLATGQPAPIAPERLADTARRAGIAAFFAVTAAAFALVWSVFTNDFSITYIMEHSNRALPAAYKFAALWSGQEGSLLLWCWLLATYGFVLRLRHKTDVKLYAYAGTIMAGIQVFFLAVVNFAAPPFALLRGSIPGRRQRSESASAISRDGDSSADAVSRLRGILSAVCLRSRRPDDALSRREVDQDHARLDARDLAVSDRRHLPRHALGLCGARLGRLLGLGPGGERKLYAMAHRHGISCTRS